MDSATASTSDYVRGPVVHFIGHTSVEVLLNQHGNTPPGRQKARAALERQLREGAQAILQANLRAAERSMRCARGDHARMHNGARVGCANSGTSCICECHDQPAGQEG